MKVESSVANVGAVAQIGYSVNHCSTVAVSLRFGFGLLFCAVACADTILPKPSNGGKRNGIVEAKSLMRVFH